MGTQDFIQYWTAFQIAINGGNPYDAQAIFQLQQSIDGSLQFPILMWNPPWLLLILAPILSLPFETARLTWLVFNILMFFGAICWLHALLIRSMGQISVKSRRLFFLGAAMFYPCIDCCGSGQLGILLLIVSVALFYCLQNNKLFVAGVLIALLSVKVHLFLPVIAVGLMYEIRCKRFKIITGGIIGIAALIALCTAFFPGATANWIHAVSNPGDYNQFPNLLTWRFETIPGGLRAIAYDHFNFRADFLMWLIPLAAIIAAIFKYRDYNVPLALKDFFTLLALSVIFAPYGWFSDFALIFPIFAAVIYRALATQQLSLALTLVASQPLIIALCAAKWLGHQFLVIAYGALIFL